MLECGTSWVPDDEFTCGKLKLAVIFGASFLHIQVSSLHTGVHKEERTHFLVYTSVCVHAETTLSMMLLHWLVN